MLDGVVRLRIRRDSQFKRLAMRTEVVVFFSPPFVLASQSIPFAETESHLELCVFVLEKLSVGGGTWYSLSIGQS